ncbi:hypothetical protein GCM10028805_27730 [Spirosoma harenae]
MRRQQIHLYLLVVGIGLTLSACFNEPNYSNTPEIEFKGLFKYTLAPGKGVGAAKRDSIVLTVGFKDGDGNLGNDNPLAKADSLRYVSSGGWGNYEIRTFRLINKQYVEYKLPINNFLLFPDLAKAKPKGPIEGTLDFNQKFIYGTVNTFYPTKFQIRIRDRDLNISNVVETDTITLPYLN